VKKIKTYLSPRLQLQKSPAGALSKSSSIFVTITVSQGCVFNVNMRFARTNDVIATDFVSASIQLVDNLGILDLPPVLG
jgi:hypothetical protein